MTTQSLLEELHRLRVQLTTDGITLNIDAPIGVITPDLWKQLAAQKQELITLLRHPDPPGQDDKDEALYLFASTVSHMVDVLGGPSHVRITKHDPDLSFEELARERRPPYQPVTLPTLPRSRCPHQVMTIKREKDGEHQVTATCQGETLPHGWCADHARSHDLLCLGALLGYPKIVSEHYTIGEGVVQWEAYAEHISHQMARAIANIRHQFRIQRYSKRLIPFIDEIQAAFRLGGFGTW